MWDTCCPLPQESGWTQDLWRRSEGRQRHLEVGQASPVFAAHPARLQLQEVARVGCWEAGGGTRAGAGNSSSSGQRGG